MNKTEEKNPNIETIIEIPKGSRNKYEYDLKNKCFRLDRMLFSSIHYPCDYGFIPETLAEDGDPMDVLVLVQEATFPGCHIQCRPIGMLEMSDEKGKDVKVLCVPTTDPKLRHIVSLKDVSEGLLDEIEHFFTTYKNLEHKETVIHGWQDVQETMTVIENARKAFRASM